MIGGKDGEGDGGSAKHSTAHFYISTTHINCLPSVLSSVVTKGGLTTRLGLWGGSELCGQRPFYSIWISALYNHVH